ncbi:HIT family protein, partial [Candidatus Gracilibacteria bacterium]|nr:HIT family protein [Candidatus Gracilibacteria bacterium]
MTTIFTRIVSGELPAAKVYEDDLTLAFLDINPASRGHSLVICKPELASLLDLSDALLVATARTTQRVAQALMRALVPDGFNIVQNNGAAAGQVVFHYHVHIIPRWAGDAALSPWRPGSADQSQLIADAALIREQLVGGSVGVSSRLVRLRYLARHHHPFRPPGRSPTTLCERTVCRPPRRVQPLRRQVTYKMRRQGRLMLRRQTGHVAAMRCRPRRRGCSRGSTAT